ncbi:MAG: RagB/SusD family nutrient uptake outer membrane protein [Bacteroidales bacterium]|nr:RagB/SusD family nutrient uptake outer membrane protein [Bacteroidales bacterium]
MKRIHIILLTFVLAFSGCTDWLTLEPQDELIREEYWKTEGDVVAVLGQAYARMSYFLDDIYYWAELRGGLLSPDEKKVSTTSLEFFNYNLNEYNDKVKWGDFYIVINLANTIIEYAPKAKENDKTFSDITYNGYMAEAYYLRSLCYFYLIKAFKDVPFILKSYSDDNQSFDYEKSTEEYITDHLITDLNYIVDMAFKPDFFEYIEEKKGRVTVNAVYALLAEIYLWNDDYQKCIETCDKISGIYLVDGEDYFSLYAGDGNSIESIFELQFDYTNYNTTNKYGDGKNLYTLTSNNREGNQETDVSEFLTSLYSVNDLRQTNEDGDYVTYIPSVTSIWKYEGLSPYDGTRDRVDRTKSRSDANWIFYRLADIYLMKAEAYAEMDNYTKSLEQLNTIKERADIPAYTNNTNKTKLLEEILNERAREFVGEGKRWFDLVRVSRRDINNRLSIIYEAVIANVDSRSRSAVASKIKDMDSWFLPIYYNELLLNKKLTQNPFYE